MLKIKYEIYYVLLAFYAILELTTNLIVNAHREHKVHNIVLYPDKHSWCKTLAIKQVISYPGCKSEEIDNNVCVGTCFSYSIPHTEPSDPGEVIVPYCDSCQPSDTTWHHVTLECTKNLIDTPPQLVKRVQIINNCSCTSCEKSLLSQIHSTNQYNDEDDNDLIMSHVHHDVPDVLKILNRINDTSTMNDSTFNHNNNNNNNNGHYDHNADNENGSSSITANNSNTLNTSENKFKDIKQLLNHKIITLLKNIQENNSIHDKEQLMELLRMIQGPNSKLNDKNIEDFVNSLHSENIELDIPKLREILIKFEHSKYYEKHRKYFDKIHHDQQIHHNIDNNNNDDNIDNNNSLHHGIHHNIHHHPHNHHHPLYEESSLSSVDNEQQNINHDESNENSFHSSEIDNQNLDEHHQHHSLSSSQSSSSVHHSHHHLHHTSHHHHPHHLHHQHHHIGENIIGHGHLARGPHGALVINPDNHENHHNTHENINDNDNSNNNDNDEHDDHHSHHSNHNDEIQHEKLDVNPHELKPNHAGTLLSYSGHTVESSRNS